MIHFRALPPFIKRTETSFRKTHRKNLNFSVYYFAMLFEIKLLVTVNYRLTFYQRCAQTV